MPDSITAPPLVSSVPAHPFFVAECGTPHHCNEKRARRPSLPIKVIDAVIRTAGSAGHAASSTRPGRQGPARSAAAPRDPPGSDSAAAVPSPSAPGSSVASASSASLPASPCHPACPGLACQADSQDRAKAGDRPPRGRWKQREPRRARSVADSSWCISFGRHDGASPAGLSRPGHFFVAECAPAPLCHTLTQTGPPFSVYSPQNRKRGSHETGYPPYSGGR